MKIIFFAVVLIFIKLTVFAQVVNDDKSFFDYTYDKSLIKNNSVESVRVDMYSGDKIYSKTIYYFDRDGRLIKQLNYDTTGAVKGEFDFISDAHQKLAGYKHTDNASHKINSVAYFKSYNNGKLIKDSSDLMPVSYAYTYDTSGHLTSTVIYTNLANAGSRRVISYSLDNAGRPKNITEMVWQLTGDTAGVKYSDRDITYNKSGKIEKETEKINVENSPLPLNAGSITYKYDGFGNLLQISRTNAASYSYTYNVKGLISSKHMSLSIEKNALQPATVKAESSDKYIYTFWK